MDKFDRELKLILKRINEDTTDVSVEDDDPEIKVLKSKLKL